MSEIVPNSSKNSRMEDSLNLSSGICSTTMLVMLRSWFGPAEENAARPPRAPPLFWKSPRPPAPRPRPRPRVERPLLLGGSPAVLLLKSGRGEREAFFGSYSVGSQSSVMRADNRSALPAEPPGSTMCSVPCSYGHRLPRAQYPFVS